MGYDLTNVFVFFIFAVVFVVFTVSVLSHLLRPRAAPADEPAKRETYECGEPAVGSSWVRFDIRFYTVALIFIIFDVEVAFLYPWAVIFEGLKRADDLGGRSVLNGLALFGFLEMLLFIGILVVGFAYCWRKGDLDWIKSAEGQARKKRPEEGPALRVKARGMRGTPLPAGGPVPEARDSGQLLTSRRGG